MAILRLDLKFDADLFISLLLPLHFKVIVRSLLQALKLYAYLSVLLLDEFPLSLQTVDILNVDIFPAEERLKKLLVLLVIRAFHGDLHLHRVVLVL